MRYDTCVVVILSAIAAIAVGLVAIFGIPFPFR
jgi:hypothetical protein